ncbi:MAG: LCP family protein [Oscillospiraceae bacterium]|nr:LCP family protein [Oscillospiraceae bacterium]
MTHAKKKTSLKDKIVLTVSIIVIVACLLTLGAVAFLTYRPYQGEGGQISPNSELDKSVNVLVTGIDYSETDTERNGQKLTDLIMVANLDLENGNVNILQIPRDTYISEVKKNSASSYDKINSIYNQTDPNKEKTQDGEIPKMGVPGLARVIEDRFKIDIDCYVSINMDNFKELVDDMGGIRINVPNRIVFSSKFGWVIEPGEQVLDGKKSEWFVRYRSGYSQGDIGRVQAQRLFMSSFVKQIMDMSPSQMLGVVKDASKYITTDMSIAQMLNIAKIVKDFDMSNMNFHLLPGESTMYGLSVYSVHKQATADLLNKYFREEGEFVSAEELNCVELRNSGNWFDDNGGSMEDIYTQGNFNPGIHEDVLPEQSDEPDVIDVKAELQ